LQKRIADLGMGWGSRDGVLELMDVLPIPQDATPDTIPLITSASLFVSSALFSTADTQEEEQ